MLTRIVRPTSFMFIRENVDCIFFCFPQKNTRSPARSCASYRTRFSHCKTRRNYRSGMMEGGEPIISSCSCRLESRKGYRADRVLGFMLNGNCGYYRLKVAASSNVRIPVRYVGGGYHYEDSLPSSTNIPSYSSPS